MALFVKRPLAFSSLLLILVVATGFFLPPLLLVIFFVAALLGSCAVLLLRICRGGSYRLLFVGLITLALLLGSGRGLLDSVLLHRAVDDRIGQTVTAEITVLSVERRNNYGSELIARLHTIDGEVARERVLIKASYPLPLCTGDRLRGSFVVQSLDHDNLYKGQDNYYRSEGCRALLLSESTDSLSLLKSGEKSLMTRLYDFRDRVSHRLASGIGGEEGELLSALLLGTRDSLSDRTVRDFRRAGVSHLLALSGLHLAILSGFADRVLLWCRVGKRVRLSAVLVVAFAYLLVTGCSFSMLRAFLMFCMTYTAYMLAEHADGLTSLLFVGALIVLASPFAVFSTSFQMTMLATFGILSFGGLCDRVYALLPRRKGLVGLLVLALRGVVLSLSISLFATLAILPVQWLVFGEISLITPLSNLILVPFMLPLLVLGIFSALTLPIAPIFAIFAFPVEKTASFVLWATRILSKPRVMLSLRYEFVPYIIIPMLAALLVLLCVDLKKKAPLVLTPVLAGVVAFCACFFLNYAQNDGEIGVVYHSVGKNDGLLLFGNEGAVICDISNGSTTQLKNHWRELQEQGATEVSVLMLTHYHSAQKASLARFAQAVVVRELWLPEPVTDADRGVLSDILAVARREGLSVSLYRYEDTLSVFGDGKLCLSEPLYQKRSTQPAFFLSLTHGEAEIIYESCAYSEFAKKEGLATDVLSADLLIIGAHGPIPHEPIALDRVSADRTVVSPHEDALNNLPDGASYEIYDGPLKIYLE